MGADTKIEWTDATWNPIRGCTRVSQGCVNCYAETVAARFSDPGQAYHGLATRSPARWTGDVRVIEEALRQPLKWKRPRKIFVNSMSDLFHEKVADETIDRIFAVMALAPQHTFQILTKRPERMLAYCKTLGRHATVDRVSLAVERVANGAAGFFWTPSDVPGWHLDNVWLGVSVENQHTANERIPLLLETPAAKRFLSCEPLLGPIDLRRLPFMTGDARHKRDALTGHAHLYAEGVDGHPDFTVKMDKPLPNRIDWVICGGESGARARHMDPDWARQLRDQCAAGGVPFFMKQMTKKATIPDDLQIRQFPEAL